MTLQHIVLLSYPTNLNPDDEAEMRRQIQTWPREIPGIRQLRFGTDLTGERTRGYQYLLYMEFDNEEALHAYQAHPMHQHFLHWALDHASTPLAFDYYLTEQTVIPVG